jgi:hypothetical protein
VKEKRELILPLYTVEELQAGVVFRFDGLGDNAEFKMKYDSVFFRVTDLTSGVAVEKYLIGYAQLLGCFSPESDKGKVYGVKIVDSVQTNSGNTVYVFDVRELEYVEEETSPV